MPVTPSEEWLDRGSGGGRRLGHVHRKLSHRTPPPVFWCVKGSLYQPLRRFAPPPHKWGGGACAHSPLNSALRFSPNALMPSSASFETKTRLIASRSMASPRSSGAPYPWVIATLAWPMATRGPAASLAAYSMAPARHAAASGNRPDTRPNSLAWAGFIGVALAMRSMPFDRPTRRSRRWVPPEPG